MIHFHLRFMKASTLFSKSQLHDPNKLMIYIFSVIIFYARCGYWTVSTICLLPVMVLSSTLSACIFGICLIIAAGLAMVVSIIFLFIIILACVILTCTGIVVNVVFAVSVLLAALVIAASLLFRLIFDIVGLIVWLILALGLVYIVVQFKIFGVPMLSSVLGFDESRSKSQYFEESFEKRAISDSEKGFSRSISCHVFLESIPQLIIALTNSITTSGTASYWSPYEWLTMIGSIYFVVSPAWSYFYFALLSDRYGSDASYTDNEKKVDPLEIRCKCPSIQEIAHRIQHTNHLHISDMSRLKWNSKKFDVMFHLGFVVVSVGLMFAIFGINSALNQAASNIIIAVSVIGFVLFASGVAMIDYCIFEDGVDIRFSISYALWMICSLSSVIQLGYFFDNGGALGYDLMVVIMPFSVSGFFVYMYCTFLRYQETEYVGWIYERFNSLTAVVIGTVFLITSKVAYTESVQVPWALISLYFFVGYYANLYYFVSYLREEYERYKSSSARYQNMVAYLYCYHVLVFPMQIPLAYFTYWAPEVFYNGYVFNYNSVHIIIAPIVSLVFIMVGSVLLLDDIGLSPFPLIFMSLIQFSVVYNQMDSQGHISGSMLAILTPSIMFLCISIVLIAYETKLYTSIRSWTDDNGKMKFRLVSIKSSLSKHYF